MGYAINTLFAHDAKWCNVEIGEAAEPMTTEVRTTVRAQLVGAGLVDASCVGAGRD